MKLDRLWLTDFRSHAETVGVRRIEFVVERLAVLQVEDSGHVPPVNTGQGNQQSVIGELSVIRFKKGERLGKKTILSGPDRHVQVVEAPDSRQVVPQLDLKAGPTTLTDVLADL